MKAELSNRSDEPRHVFRVWKEGKLVGFWKLSWKEVERYEKEGYELKVWV